MFRCCSVEKSTLSLQASTIQAASVLSADTEDELAHYNHSYGLEGVQASDLTSPWGNSCLSLKSPSVPWPPLVTPPRCDRDVLPEPQQQPRQPPADGYIQPGYGAQELAVKEMEEAISPREALALLNTGWQSVFPRAWQSSSQHFPPKRLHPSVRCNRRNERSDFSPDRMS